MTTDESLSGASCAEPDHHIAVRIVTMRTRGARPAEARPGNAPVAGARPGARPEDAPVAEAPRARARADEAVEAREEPVRRIEVRVVRPRPVDDAPPEADQAVTDPSAIGPAATPPGDGRRSGFGARLLAVGAVVLAVLGVGLVGWVATHQVAPPPAAAVDEVGPPPPTVPGRAADPGEGVAASSPPASLRVDAIGVDAPVDEVGLNPDRTMQVPAKGPLYDHPAWFRYSVTPGRQGPSVIIGHVDSAEEGPSVFYELGRLRPGDRVDVTRRDGAVVSFEVTEVAAFPKDAFPTERVYGPTPGPELRLITCGGTFDAAARSYRDNTVAFARELPV